MIYKLSNNFELIIKLKWSDKKCKYLVLHLFYKKRVNYLSILINVFKKAFLMSFSYDFFLLTFAIYNVLILKKLFKLIYTVIKPI